EPPATKSRGPETTFRNFSDTSAELVRSRLPHPEKAVFCKGRFPESLPDDLPPLVFVSLDPDLYAPALAGLRAFWPKLVPGGLILIHDYNSRQFKGVKEAVQLFCEEEGLSVLPLADLHGSAALMKSLRFSSRK
ncbi:MAG TPA: methyltransferase, partial [Lachnospiraceae bacterium]|nr:methyltransferase [Lachnospiraceae bacterium]